MTKLPYIPFNRPFTVGNELDYVADAIRGAHLSGNGPFSRRCAEWLERGIGSRRALLTPSCTAALEMAAILADIGPGDEVVMPSFTFVSTANAVVLRGAVPVFVDIRPDTLNLDESKVEDAMTPRTKAIIAVHYAGVACEVDALAATAHEHGALFIEDAAQAILSTYRGRPLGNLGDVAALSFHETKNVICGEGGALLVNREDWIERAEIVHEKGTNRRQFFRGQVDKYSWVDIGSSYPLSEVNAAFLWAQLEAAEEITARRLEIWRTYHEALEPLEAAGAMRRPIVPEHCSHNAHLYYVLLAAGVDRDEVIVDLRRRGVDAVFHYVPLHSAPAGVRYGRVVGDLRATDEASEQLVRLPLWVGMTPDDVERVAAAVDAAITRRSATRARA